MSFQVRYTASAREDLERLYEHVIERSTTLQDLELAEQAFETIRAAVGSLERSPFIYRKAGTNPFLRELLIPFGRNGYVALFEIEDSSNVSVLAVRHQLEDDYH